MEGSSQSASAAKQEYAKFVEKVGKTIYLDNLSLKVTKAVIRAALGQFGTVVDVQFIPNYSGRNIPQCALVEMETEKEAKSMIQGLQEVPFMIGGMPRPVRVEAAEAEMFVDRPAPPGRKIECHWVDPSDPYFENGRIYRRIIRRHAREAEILLQLQLEKEEKLQKLQNEILKSNFKKLKTVDSVVHDGSLYKLERRYRTKAGGSLRLRISHDRNCSDSFHPHHGHSCSIEKQQIQLPLGLFLIERVQFFSRNWSGTKPDEPTGAGPLEDSYVDRLTEAQNERGGEKRIKSFRIRRIIS